MTTRKEQRHARALAETPNTSHGPIMGQDYRPTAADRKQVRMAAGYGLPLMAIAGIMGMTGENLRRHFPRELETESSNCNLVVAGTLYRIATDPTHPNVATAAIFWLKCRAGWVDKQVIEHSVPGSAKDLSDDELAAIATGGRPTVAASAGVSDEVPKLVH